MTVAELQPVCKSWKILIDPKAVGSSWDLRCQEYMRDVMLSKALKVIHGLEA